MDLNALYRRAIGVIAILFAIVVLVAMRPIAVPIILGAWCAALSRPVHARLSRAIGNRFAAAAMTAGLLVVLLARLRIPGLPRSTDRRTRTYIVVGWMCRGAP